MRINKNYDQDNADKADTLVFAQKEKVMRHVENRSKTINR